MPAQKSKKPVQPAAKPATKVAAKPASRATPAKAVATVVAKLFHQVQQVECERIIVIEDEDFH